MGIFFNRSLNNCKIFLPIKESDSPPIIVIKITSNEEMEDLFQTLNKLLPLSEVYKIGDKNKKNT